MSNKNIYEIFNEFKKASTKKERIDVLRNNDNWALRNVLMGVFDKRVEFAIKKVPEYRCDEVPAGMSYNHMSNALSKVYLFMKNNPKTPEGLTEQRKVELLTQLLESLEPNEAEVFVGMLQKDLKIPYLTETLVNEAFEGLLPKT